MNAQAFVHRMLEALARWAIYGLFFLIPIVFCSQTADPFEVNKQLVLITLSCVALLGWLAHMVLSQELRMRSSWLNLLPLLFFATVVTSAVFSLAGFQTWIGGSVQEYTSVLTTGTLVLLFYTLSNLVGRLVSLRGILLALLLSASFSGLLALLSLFDLYQLPFAFTAHPVFNTVGSLNLFAIFELTVLFLGLTAWTMKPVVHGTELLGGRVGAVTRVLIVFVAGVTMSVLLAIDFWMLWMLGIFGVLLLLAVGLMKGGEALHTGRFFLPFVVLIVSMVFLVLPTPLHLDLPVTISSSYASGWHVARATLSQGTQQLLLGSGPGTFVYEYALFKSPSVNETILWDTLFDRAKSHVLTLLTTSGMVGTAAWVLLFLVLGLHAMSRLAFERHLDDGNVLSTFFVPWAMLVLSHVFYSSNMTLTFLLWAFSGVLASQVILRERTANFAMAPRLAFITSFVFVLMVVTTVGTLVFAGQRYLGERAFYRALEKDRTHAPIQDMLSDFHAAVRAQTILPYDTHLRHLSFSYLAYARELLSQTQGQPTQEQIQHISKAVSSAVDAGRAAVAAGDRNVANWVVLGSVYRDVMPFTSDAEDLALAAFQRAIELEPANPSHHTHLARVYIAVADRAHTLASGDADLSAETAPLAAAEASLKRAIDLKSDFASAHYYLAVVYERQDKLEEAAASLLALTRYRPTDVGLGFQLAMLYIRLETYDAARAELERIIGLNPRYSNALWYLSVVEESEGNVEKALEYARRVLELNPDDEAAQARVQALESGLVIPEELPAPVEEGGQDEIAEE